ncbi:hypothetical protein CLUG_03603 [Clavispora lusitaniae ATCC 42720]|uniref:Uncharacterized protein n=1 Tax=Clavispora lusitaniae (strain ATCC 42720) TaxID=306902 RepID=C4Y619_CLAL4|nr:uncharacterized protein CLUG_03603 [Clavispora lusitaniae ATCC 42720]EEQ39474.1 hypothetical protein CLUG_03603 [Clavispora lusitaniae ATCC 42720]
MTHSSAWRSRNTGNEGNNRLRSLWSGQVMLLQELRSFFLGSTTNLTNQNDTLGFWVVQVQGQGVDEVCTWEWVTTHTNDQRLTQANVGGLRNGFVSQSTGSRNDTNTASLVDAGRHNTNLTLVWSNQTRTVRTNQSSLGSCLQDLGNSHHVVLRNTFSDGNSQFNLSFDGLLNSSSSNWWRNKDTCRSGTSLLNGIPDIGENWSVQVGGSSLLWVGSTYNFGAVSNGSLGVESRSLTGETLVDDLGVLVDFQVLDGGSVVSGDRGRGEATDKLLGQHCDVLLDLIFSFRAWQ